MWGGREEKPPPGLGIPSWVCPGDPRSHPEPPASAGMGGQRHSAVSARLRIPPRLAALAGSLHVTTASQTGVQRTRINMMQIGRLSQAPQAGGRISTQPSTPAGRSGNNNNNTDNQGNWQGRPPPSPSVHTSEAGRWQRRGAAQVSELQQGGPERPRPTPEVALRVTGRPGAEI